MSFVLVLALIVLAIWCVASCVIGFVIGGAVRLADEHKTLMFART